MTDPHLELLDDARHAQAVADRAQRRLLGEADDQDATFARSLRAVAQAGGTVLVETTVGRSIRGRVDALGVDHVVVTDDRVTSYVRVDQLTAIRGVRGAAPVRAAADGAGAGGGAQLVDLLGQLGREHAEVDCHLVGGATVRGTVRRAGADVLTLRAPTGDETLVQLPLLAVLVVHGRRP